MIYSAEMWCKRNSRSVCDFHPVRFHSFFFDVLARVVSSCQVCFVLLGLTWLPWFIWFALCITPRCHQESFSCTSRCCATCSLSLRRWKHLRQDLSRRVGAWYRAPYRVRLPGAQLLVFVTLNSEPHSWLRIPGWYIAGSCDWHHANCWEVCEPMVVTINWGTSIDP